MNRLGSFDATSLAGAVPRLAGLAGEAWVQKGGQVLEHRTEIERAPGDLLVPQSVRAAIPPWGSITVSRWAESPAGPFALAELSVVVRIGARGALFHLGGFCDSEPARALLAERWGMRLAPAEILLEELYYQVTATVIAEARTVLALRFTGREPLPGTRLSVPPLLVLATLDDRLILAGAPLDAATHRNERGRGELQSFDAAAFGAPAFRPTSPMTCTWGTVDLTRLPIEFTVDPVRPAEDSLVVLGA